MLPYPSYLRVYEPAEVFPEVTDSPAGAEGTERVAVTVASEQQVALTGVVSGRLTALEAGAAAQGFVLTREGRRFVCPLDLPLRCWLALGELAETLGEPALSLIVPADARASADEEFVRWRRDHPATVPHIRQASWGVPRTWFLLVVEDEREAYDAHGRPGVRYRARLADARHRLTRARSTLASVIEDLDLHDELTDLTGWLDAFGDDGWVELDYAGAAQLLGAALAEDQSARDVHIALRALRRGDFASAGLAYRRFEERWRQVHAFERAN